MSKIILIVEDKSTMRREAAAFAREMSKAQAKDRAKITGYTDGKLVSSFLPRGRTGLYIYAVTVKNHPDKVKIGMTTKWVSRRQAYATWDLAAGDGIVEERVFCICEEFVDLRKLENHILKTFPHAIASGAEWFFATIDEAARHIDHIMCEHSISYDLGAPGGAA